MTNVSRATPHDDGIRVQHDASSSALRRHIATVGPVSAGAEATMRWVDPGELSVDPELQRAIKLHALRHLTANWNLGLCSPLTVSVRPGGKMVVICGQHRWRAARAKKEQEIPALVWSGLSGEDESNIFLAEDNRVRVTPYDRLKLRQRAGDVDALALGETMRRTGYAFSPKTTKPEPNKITAINALEAVYHMDSGATPNGTTLRTTLSGVLRKAFDSDTTQFHGGLIVAVGKIVSTYCDDVDLDGLAAVLKATGVLGVKSQALLIASQGQARGWRAWALAILGLYNNTKRGRNRLMADVLR
jgi:hypothetical protein